jgi:NADPH:quinone reductase-like Zn-dependent oxidoreductase
MKAFVVDRYKSKTAVRLAEMPEPEVQDDDVLVQVHAASLNQLDSKIRDGASASGRRLSTTALATRFFSCERTASS